MRESKNEKLLGQITSKLGFRDLKEMSAFLKEILGEVRVAKADIERYVSELSADQKRLASTPYPVTAETLRRMYETSVFIYEQA